MRHENVEDFLEVQRSDTLKRKLETIRHNITNKKQIDQTSDIPEQAEQEHLANLHFFESMDRINRAIQRTNDLEQMMSDVLDVVLSIFDCDRAFLLYPCDPEAVSWCAPMERTKPDYPGAHAIGLKAPMDPDIARVCRLLLESDGPVKFGHDYIHPLPREMSKLFEYKSQILMALYPKIGVPWVFGLHQCSSPRIWTQQEERILKEIGRRLADGLTSLLMYRDLKARENKYRELADSISNVFFAMDQNLKYTYWNKALENITGIQAEEALGKSHQEIFPDMPWARRAEKVYRDVLRTQQSRIFVNETDFGGKSYVLEINAYPSMSGLSVFIKNITERKKAQEALKESEERLRLMTETIEDVFWMSTPGMKEMRYISSSYEKIWGRTCKSLYENPKSFLETVHPEDRNIPLDILKTCHKPGKQYSCEYRIVSSQGQIKWISERGYPICDDNGNLRYMTGVCSEITNFKLVEEALKDSKHRLKKHAYLTKTLLDGFPCIALLLRPETREIVTSNKAAVETGAVSGKTCFETWAQRSEPCPWCLAPKVWTEGKAQHLEIEYMGTAWDAYWVPVSDDLYMHFAFDISERKKIEKSLLEYQKQLKSLASQLTLIEEKERYRIATELHDHIGQYLAVSRIKMEEIRHSIDSKDAQLTLECVCEWLDHIIEEIRSLTFNLSSPILYELGFERAVAAWLKDEVEKKHNIETIFESDELPKLLDDDVCVLLLRNVKELLFNIIKHAQARKVQVYTSLSNGDIEVQIKDDGIGFDYAEVSETAAVKSKFGLFSIRERLEHFGGRMEIDSVPGQGTLIKLFAPLKKN